MRITHEGHQLTGIDLDSRGVIPADALFFNSSYHRNCDIPQLLGCGGDSDETTPTSKTQSTKAPGVFVAGDADGDVQFAVIAAAAGATAAVAIVKELQLEEQLELERCPQHI
jgi:thioredoxin reductase